MKLFFSFYITLFLTCFFMMVVSIPDMYAQNWGIAPSGAKQEVTINNLAPEKKDFSGDERKDGALSNSEAAWNIDFEGMSYMMSDQPATDQFIANVTGIGVTYKFAEKLQALAKLTQFTIDGKNGSKWEHQHALTGIGFRSFFAKNTQQWQVNVMTGTSKVSEETLGEVENLEPPIFVDIKYLWIFGENFFIGSEITFARVANKCEEINGTYMECGSGGYTSFGLTFQIPMPDSWGK